MTNSTQSEINGFIVEFKGQDRLEVSLAESIPKMKVFGCEAMLTLVRTKKEKEGTDIRKWSLPSGNAHEEIILREVLLRLQGKWQTPYSEAELCHCRSVATEVVEQAILNGAHTPEAISLQTSASTACGTCKPIVEQLIANRLR